MSVATGVHRFIISGITYTFIGMSKPDDPKMSCDIKPPCKALNDVICSYIRLNGYTNFDQRFTDYIKEKLPDVIALRANQ